MAVGELSVYLIRQLLHRVFVGDVLNHQCGALVHAYLRNYNLKIGGIIIASSVCSCIKIYLVVMGVKHWVIVVSRGH